MNIEQMAHDARERVLHSINRSAGQHMRAMRKPTADEWSRESMESATVCHQIEMNKLAILYEIGCKYGISDVDSRRLCNVAGIDFAKLMESTGV